jgi:hypothetical protein
MVIVSLITVRSLAKTAHTTLSGTALGAAGAAVVGVRRNISASGARAAHEGYPGVEVAEKVLAPVSAARAAATGAGEAGLVRSAGIAAAAAILWVVEWMGANVAAAGNANGPIHGQAEGEFVALAHAMDA